MSAVRIAADQVRVIHALKSKARLADANYRAMLSGFGVSSSKDLTATDAYRLMDQLRELAPKNPGAVAMTGRYGAKIRALWIAGWNLGVVRDRTDQAACAFVERQTGVERTAWLVEPAQGRAAIEALKAWLAREAGVEWPRGQAAEPVEHKHAVLAAQWRRLAAIGVLTPGREAMAGLVTVMEAQLGRELRSWNDAGVTLVELDAISRKLGARIRRGALRRREAA